MDNMAPMGRATKDQREERGWRGWDGGPGSGGAKARDRAQLRVCLLLVRCEDSASFLCQMEAQGPGDQSRVPLNRIPPGEGGRVQARTQQRKEGH